MDFIWRFGSCWLSFSLCVCVSEADSSVLAAGSSRSRLCVCSVRTWFGAKTQKKEKVRRAGSPGLLVSPVLRSGPAPGFAFSDPGGA